MNLINYQRADAGIPEDAFVVMISGNRLDSEIDDSFIDLLNKLIKEGIYILVVGPFNNTKEKISDCTNIIHIPYSKNIIDVFSMADVYIQPTRIGGGTTAFSSLYAGVPVLITPYGDSSYVAGKDEFIVETYDDMYSGIISMLNDPEYTNQLKQAAHERGLSLAFGERIVKELLEKVL